MHSLSPSKVPSLPYLLLPTFFFLPPPNLSCLSLPSSPVLPLFPFTHPMPSLGHEEPGHLGVPGAKVLSSMHSGQARWTPLLVGLQPLLPSSVNVPAL